MTDVVPLSIFCFRVLILVLYPKHGFQDQYRGDICHPHHTESCSRCLKSKSTGLRLEGTRMLRSSVQFVTIASGYLWTIWSGEENHPVLNDGGFAKNLSTPSLAPGRQHSQHPSDLVMNAHFVINDPSLC